MAENSISDDLLARHLAGESTPDEDRSVLAWAGGSAENQDEYDRLRAAWDAPPAEAAVDVDAAWQRVASQMGTADRGAVVLPIRRALWRKQQLWRIAAAAVLLLGGGLIWQQWQARDTSLVYATLDGERREVTLPDGSLVLLAARSTMTVPADFGSRAREVHLDGEAWFSAVHEGVAPLTVRTASHLVRDVGTVFTVRAREADAVDVAVLEGEVAVRAATDSEGADQALRAGDVGRFRITAAPVIAVGRSVDSLAGWQRGTLAVDGASVADVLTELSRWYGMPITVADPSLRSRSITATLSLISRDAAIDVLSLLLGVTATSDGAGIVLR